MGAILYLILFLPFFVSVFWVVNLLCNNPKKNLKPQNIWILFLLAMSICSFVWGILFNGIQDYSSYYILDVLDIIFTLSVLPFVYLFFRSITDKNKFTWKQYIWFVPGIVIGGASLVLYLLIGKEQAAILIKDITEHYNDFYPEAGTIQEWLYILVIYVFSIVLFLQVVTIMTYSTISLIRYKKGLGNYFSNLDGKSIEDSRAVLIGIFGLLLLGLVAICLWSVSFDNYFFIRHILIGGTGVLIFYMSYHVSKIKFTAESIAPEPEEKISDIITQNKIYIKLLPLFIKLINEEKIFLHPNLSLDDIARRINSNRTYISRLINEEFQCTFSDYINRQRIEYAQKLIRTHPNLTQEQIAEQSGFIHASSFSRAFKQHAGITFRSWKQANCIF